MYVAVLLSCLIETKDAFRELIKTIAPVTQCSVCTWCIYLVCICFVFGLLIFVFCFFVSY